MLSEISLKKDGEIITELVAKVKKVFELKLGEAVFNGVKTKTTSQGIVITDGETDIWVNLKDHNVIPKEAEGTMAKIASYYSDERKAWFGAKKGSYEKDGKLHTVINISKTGKFEEVRDDVVTDTKVPFNPPVEYENNKAKQQPLAAKAEQEKTDWLAVERRKHRAMAISYAKDLVINKVLKFELMEDYAHTIEKFIWNEQNSFDANGILPEFEAKPKSTPPIVLCGNSDDDEQIPF